jgi:hypothetical protein
MVNEEILGGLKSALERGSSLERAMLTLFNSGYKREEIEEAARSLLEFRPESQIQAPIKTVPKTAEVKPVPQVLTTPTITKAFPELKPSVTQRPIPAVQQLQPSIQIQKPIQKVSSYEEEKQKVKVKGRGVIVFLVFLLVFLVGLLGTIFIFRQQLIDFLSSFFG